MHIFFITQQFSYVRAIFISVQCFYLKNYIKFCPILCPPIHLYTCKELKKELMIVLKKRECILTSVVNQQIQQNLRNIYLYIYLTNNIKTNDRANAMRQSLLLISVKAVPHHPVLDILNVERKSLEENEDHPHDANNLFQPEIRIDEN